jgi:chemotaxis protein MotB
MLRFVVLFVSLAAIGCSSMPYVTREDHDRDLQALTAQMDQLEAQKKAQGDLVAGEKAAHKATNDKLSTCLREKTTASDDLESTRKALDNCTQSRGVGAKDLANCQIDKDKVERELKLCGSDRNRLESDAKATKAENDKQKAEFDKLKGQLIKVESGIQQVKQRLQKLVASGALRVKSQHGFLVIEVSSDILFDLNKAELKPDAKPVLGQVASALKELADKRFQVAGHTDNTGPAALNWKLSTERALAVVGELVTQGVKPDNLSAGGYGPYLPVAGNDTDEGRARNRRVELLLLPNLSELFKMVE